MWWRNRTVQSFVLFLVSVGWVYPAWGQGNLSDIDKPGVFNKYLTPTTMDRWNFSGKNGEALFVDVRTKEFDAVVSLLRREGESKETILESVDDEGSNGKLMIRLPADGQYSIGVQGFEQKGGGNYSLRMDKYMSEEITVDQVTSGTLDRDGRANFYLVSTKEQCVTIELLVGTSQAEPAVLDHKGNEVNPWSNVFTLHGPGLKQQNAYWLRLKGDRNQPYKIRIKSALRAKLDGELELSLEADQAAVLDVNGSAGAFRLLEMVSSRKVTSRWITPQSHRSTETILDDRTEFSKLTTLKDYGKGRRKGYAVLLGTDSRYEFQLYSPEAAQITLKLSDPREKLSIGEASRQVLRVGEYRYFQFQPKPGQTTTIRANSDEFDTLIQLFDNQGSTIATNDDYRDEMNSQLRYTSYTDSPLTIAVSAQGNGGGGKFAISLQADEPKLIMSGERKTQTMSETGSELWLYRAKEGEQIILYCKSRSGASLVVKNAQGIAMGQDQEESDQEADRIVKLIKFPTAGDYTIEATAETGAMYLLQVIPAE